MRDETRRTMAVGAGILIGVLISCAGLFYGLHEVAEIPSRTALVLTAIPSSLVLAFGGVAFFRGVAAAGEEPIPTIWKALAFWLGLAPIVLFAGWRLFAALAFSGLAVVGLREPIPPVLFWPLHTSGALAGVGLLVLVRRQISSYSEQDAV